jgi:hypothetical protein
MLFFLLGTIVVSKISNVVMGRPSAAAAKRQHKFERLQRQLSSKQMSLGAEEEGANHTIDWPALHPLLAALGVLTLAFVVELVVVAVPSYNETLFTKVSIRLLLSVVYDPLIGGRIYCVCRW